MADGGDAALRIGAVARGRRGRRLGLVVAAAVVGVVVVSTLLWFSGGLRARVSWPSDRASFGETWRPTEKKVAVDVLIKNDGWTDLRVAGVGQDMPGLRLIKDAGFSITHPDQPRTVPFTLKPGESVAVNIVYQITDCAAVPGGRRPVQVRVDRWWGTESATVSPPRFVETGQGLNAVGPDGAGVEWQRAVADMACGPNANVVRL